MGLKQNAAQRTKGNLQVCETYIRLYACAIKKNDEEEEFILVNQAQTFTVMAVDITGIEINKYNIQHNLCSYRLSRGDPEGKQIPLLGPPLIHDNIGCTTVPIRNKNLK